MRVKTGGVVAGVLLVLAGCGSGPSERARPEIATLRSAAPSSAAASPERPLIRPGEGREEFDRYVAVYDQCLRDHGAKAVHGGKAEWGSDAQREAATGACGHLYPELWIERERRTNPEFGDLLRAEAKCLKDRGHDVKVGGDPESLLYGDNTSANQAYDDQQECERQVFASNGFASTG